MSNLLENIWGVIKDKPAQIVDEAMEGLGNMISNVIRSIFSGVDRSFQDFIEMGPNFAKFNTYLDATLKTKIMDGCMIFGYALLIILTLIYIIQYLIHVGKVKTSPFATAGRVVIAYILIHASSSLIGWISVISTHVFDEIFKRTRLSEFSFVDLLMGAFSADEGLVLSGIHIACFGTFPPLTAFAMLFTVLFSWPLIKNFFKYLLEMVERYLICCVVMMLFPAVAPLLILDDTSTVIKSYFRMLGGQIFLISTSGLFLSGAISLIQSGKGKESIFGYIFVLGYLRVIQRVDYYLQAMGLNVAQATGMIADSLTGAARGIASGFQMANAGRKSVGETMQAIGAHTGNKDLFASGAVIGASISGMARNGLPVGTDLNKQFLDRAAKAGTMVSQDARASADAINGFMHSPRNYQGAYNLDQDSLNAGISRITGMEGVENTKLKLDGSITFTAPGTDGEMASFTLSDTNPGNGTPLINDMGETTAYLSSGNSIAKGDTVSGSYSDILAMSGAMDMDSSTDMDMGSISSISSATYDGRSTSFMNDSGDTIAVMDQNNDFLQPAPLTSGGRVDEGARDTVTNDLDRLYGEYDYKKRRDGKARIRYNAGSGRAYVEIRKNDSANWNKLYIQDTVSKDTFMPSRDNLSDVHYMRHSSNSGKHLTRYAYGLDNTPATTEKSAAPSGGYTGKTGKK